MPGGRHDLHTDPGRLNLDVYLPFIQLAFPQQFAEALPSVALPVRLRPRQQGIEQAVLGGILGAVADLADFMLPRHLDRHVGQVADDGIHLAADVPHLGELGRLHLDERRAGQPRQPPGDLRLANAGGPDHEDVLRRDLAAQGFAHLHAAPAIAKRYGHGTLGLILADDVLVQFLGDFPGRHRHRNRPRDMIRPASECIG